MSRKILLIIFLIAVLGGLMGFRISSYFLRPAGANTDSAAMTQGGNLFKDFYDNHIKDYFKFLAPKFSGFSTSTIFLSTATSSPVVPYVPTVDYEQAIINSVEKASPAVVAITISKNVPIIEQCPYDPFAGLPREYKQFFGQDYQFSQPCQKGTQLQEVGGGSGFIISSDGLIVTNKHVVSDVAAKYTVLTNDGKKYNAEVVARDPSGDVAVVKISASNLPVLELGDSAGLKLGQTVIGIGNALGEFRNTVSVGVVSGLARNITASGGGVSENIGGLIQTDAAINPGNSGGPLLNLKGEVIGIDTAMVSGAENIGFAIPINQVKRAIDSVRKTGKIITPYLGVRYTMIDDALAADKKLGVSEGALIEKSDSGAGVVKDSPAMKAGIKEGDIVEEVGGEKVTQANPLSLILQKYVVGDVIVLKILRNGKELSLNVTLEERPKNL
ncbi:MAG: trypsin-like peptidase domain-containing protein [Candidatus Wolfebacteria bacterium]|nr:trypsin-like peptidase domain-containing protein [Candidatus Wolfebacteria bacterium]